VANAADREQQDEREHEEDDGDRRSGGRVAALDPSEDVDGRDLRLEREVPGDDDERPELPDRLGEGECHPGEDSREDVREDHPTERGEARRPERARGLLDVGVELAQDRLHRPDDERERDEHHREHDRRARVRDVDADRRLRSIEREEREAGDDRREREREVDDRVDERLSAKVVPHQDPRRHRAEQRIQERDADGGPECQLQRRDRLGLGDRIPESLGAAFRRLPDERADRQEHEHAQEDRDETEGQGCSGPVPRSPRPARGDSNGRASQ
jgi:hypothetical protein